MRITVESNFIKKKNFIFPSLLTFSSSAAFVGPPSPKGTVNMEYVNAFVVGGLICVIGQLLIDLTKLTPARIMVIFVCSGVLLGALGLYDNIVNFAGSGGSVPLSGFGNLLAQGVKKAVDEKGFIGIFSGGISAAASGITAATVFAFIAALLRKPNDKT